MNDKVELLLKDGSTIKGELIGYDDHMNLVLSDSEEIKKDKHRKLGTIVLRGNNVVTINPM